MKKTLAIILSVIMVLSLLPVTAFAENGPKPYNEDDDYTAYVVAYEMDSDGEVAYDDDGEIVAYYNLYDADEDYEIDELDGAYYDLESNTLYLDNIYYPELCIETNGMGDDFTVNVKGVCELGKFAIWGDGYGGSLTVDGPGKLIVNKDNYSYYAFLLDAEETESALTFGERVTVEAYGEEYAICVSETTVKEAAESVVFTNGEEHPIIGGAEIYLSALGFKLIDPDSLEEPQSFGPMVTNPDDPDGIYVYNQDTYYEDENDEEGTEVYYILKLIYLEEYDTYFYDLSFGDEGAITIPADEFDESGFVPVVDDEGNPVEFINENPIEIIMGMLAVDEDGNCYALAFGFDIDDEGNFNIVFTVYDLVEINGLDDVYYFVENTEVNGEDLTPVTVIDETSEGPFDYYVDEAEFNYVGTKFPDVPSNAWFYDAAMYNAYNGFIGGYSNGKFGPADALQRQDFVVILARIAGVDLTEFEGQTGGLSDVNATAYYASAVAWAVDSEIIKGYDNGKFGVGDKITREQVATILYRALGNEGGNESVLAGFADKDKISSFAKDAMIWAVSNGIISGKNATTLAPTATASRAEIATIIMRMDQKGMFNPKV